MRTSFPMTTAVMAALALASSAHGQDTASVGPKVGELAPDFTLPASTKEGVGQLPIHLADLRGQTVVLAFFPRARTAG